MEPFFTNALIRSPILLWGNRAPVALKYQSNTNLVCSSHEFPDGFDDDRFWIANERRMIRVWGN